MDTPNAVAREAGSTFIILLVVSNVVNLILDLGFSIAAVSLATVVFSLGAQMFGYSIGHGLARTRIAASEEYGAAAARFQQAASRYDLRESLDEAGQHAYDLLEEAVARSEESPKPPPAGPPDPPRPPDHRPLS